LSQGASVNSTTDTGETALHIAARRNCTRCAKVISSCIN